MTPERALSFAIEPALSLLPPKMDTRAARVQVLAIWLQESELRHRRQMNGGPARGYPQFEVIGVRDVLTRGTSLLHARKALLELDYSVEISAQELHAVIEHHDVLAAVLSRLALWNVPRLLPALGDYDAAWQMYIDGWHPGKPHRETWNGYYVEAMETVKEIA